VFPIDFTGCVAGGIEFAVPGAIVSPVCDARCSPHGFPSFHVVVVSSLFDLHPNTTTHAITTGAKLSITTRRI
jgi:hypothetical protein